MNIFVLDTEPDICASYHNDCHVVKMITEAAQMLSTACRLSGIDEGYRVTHQNHPCSIWTRESQANWAWLHTLCFFLNCEWQRRFNHKLLELHKGWEVASNLTSPPLPDVPMTPFAQAMPTQYQDADPVKAYRAYYMGEKRHLARWKNGQPNWWR